MRNRTIIIVGAVAITAIALIALSSSKPSTPPVARSTLNCTGKGSPTVILYTGPEAAVGDPWSKVSPKISGFTQVCDYHRSLLGTGQQMADELTALLKEKSVLGPYVLVTNALYNWGAQVYVAQHREQVVALVFVNPFSEDTIAGDLAILASYPDDLAQYRQEWTDYLDEGLSFDDWQAANVEQVRAAGALGDLPLIIIVPGKTPAFSKPYDEQMLAMYTQQQQQLLKLSTNSLLLAADQPGGKSILRNEPHLVTAAIRLALSPKLPLTPPIVPEFKFEPNDNFDQAAQIALHVKYDQLDLALLKPGADGPDPDYFKVRVKPDRLITCHTFDLSGGVDTNLALYDDKLKAIASNDNSDPAQTDLSSSITYTSTYEGWLYVLVSEGVDHSPTETQPATYSLECSTGSSGPTVSTATTSVPLPTDIYQRVSQDSLFDYMTDLTAIQPYSGWRNSATEGEAEALDYVAGQLQQFEYLKQLGLTLERQDFRVFLATELWETRLEVQIAGRDFEIPADGLRGHRDVIDYALHFDSDGKLNDANRDPVVVNESIVVVRTADDINALKPGDVQGKVVFLDYAPIDTTQVQERAYDHALTLLRQNPAGIVVVTHFSNAQHESHGTFIGDGQPFGWLDVDHLPPILYVRLEDMKSAGIKSWEDLAQITSARLTWDADVFSPGTSGNLIAHIPGADATRALILGGHIDSPNSPGAMDDGSGSVVLLEVARVLNAAQLQPPTDLYLVWFGSEELSLYGSAHFAATHQDLLDRTTAMLQVDMLSRPVDDINPYLNLITWSYGRHGDAALPWPDYLTQKSAGFGVTTRPLDSYAIESDNSALAGFDVPNANLIYIDEPAMLRLGSVHYASHIHDPYDTVELARESGEVLVQMAQVALAAALETGRDDPELRIAPRPDRHALFIASHTEPTLVGPVGFIDLAMSLAWAGFDVDLIPYGQSLTPADLANTDLVVVLPVMDYPSPDGDVALYDEAWSPAEIDALEEYVANGGFLVLTNSAHRLKLSNRTFDANEDWSDVNALAERFGVTFLEETIHDTQVQVTGDHPLTTGVKYLALAEENGVPFTTKTGLALAQAADGATVAAVIDQGRGHVLVLADVGILDTAYGDPGNLPFWHNLADYARR
ncbi:Aminopeptidase S [Thermoflexales bacterium]|nr:Aminopeptidase S [Thermoflexales bacterium]